MTETLRTADGRGVLRIERRLAHPPRKVWRAITEPEHLRHWFPFEAEIELTPGGKIAFSEHGDPAADRTYGEVVECDPPRVFAFRWEGDELHFDLRADGDATLLVFTHTFGDVPGAASFSAGWMTCFDALELVLDERPGELVPDRDEMDARHEHYVAAFGLHAGTVTETADGWQVRFERQLTRPVDLVWTALSGGATPDVGAPPPAGFTASGVPAGPVTALAPPGLLEYELGDPAAGRVRWELTDGTGQGARLIVVHRSDGSAPARDTALAAWQARIEELAAHLLTVSR